MNKFSTIKIDNSMINDYLFYRNLLINRKFASSKKKLRKLITISGGLKVKKKDIHF